VLQIDRFAGWKHCGTAGWKPALRERRARLILNEKLSSNACFSPWHLTNSSA
jgi:hypothetical protein